jgi:hypothetical protein
MSILKDPSDLLYILGTLPSCPRCGINGSIYIRFADELPEGGVEIRCYMGCGIIKFWPSGTSISAPLNYIKENLMGEEDDR